jgi:hypothetical protein
MGIKGDEGDEPGAEWLLTDTHHLLYLLPSPYLLFLHKDRNSHESIRVGKVIA